jgi:N-acetylmuramoyl-L-alanine amidase
MRFSSQCPRIPLLSTLAVLVLLCVPAHAALAGARLAQSTPYVVVLDPGHGGPDPGAADASQKEVEKILTLQVALQAADDLRAMGYRVFLTRTRDQPVNTPPRDLNHDGVINHVDEMVARNLIANRHHADVFVSIHFDASLSPDIHGTHGYFCPVRPFWRQSAHLANLLTAAVSSSLASAGYSSPDSGVRPDVQDMIPQTRADYPWFLVLGPSLYHFVTATTMPGARVETLFLTSPSDNAALRRAPTLPALGRGYANGIRAYFGGKVRH